MPTEIARRIALPLRWGSFLSALFLLMGIFWVLAAPETAPETGPPMALWALGRQLAEGNPYAVMQLGILLLLATPILRVFIAGFAFWAGGERRYAWVSFVLLALITLSVLVVRSA